MAPMARPAHQHTSTMDHGIRREPGTSLACPVSANDGAACRDDQSGPWWDWCGYGDVCLGGRGPSVWGGHSHSEITKAHTSHQNWCVGLVCDLQPAGEPWSLVDRCGPDGRKFPLIRQ